MILILSEKHDRITDGVASWLNHYNMPYLRINEGDEFNVVDNIKINNSEVDVFFRFNNKLYSLNCFDIIWCRRGNFFISSPPLNKLSHDNTFIKNAVKKHLNSEVKTLMGFVYNLFNDKFVINNPLKYNVNKLIVLHKAAKLGLKIPETYISKDNISTSSYFNGKKKIITKNIQDILQHQNEEQNILIGQATTKVPYNFFNKKRKEFFYSLFQKEIEKKYELRIFYFKDYFFSAAIFSQNNDKTRIDFRNYDFSHQNRILPYTLNNSLENKLKKLMHELSLESGSIDMIIDKNNEAYFLEVNPVGQLEWINKSCNFYIEKFIADFLKNAIKKR